MTDHPYAGAQAHAARAEAALRAGRPEAVLTDVNRAHALLRRVGAGLGDLPAAHPDPGLHAQLLTLEACALAGDPPGTDAAGTLAWLRAELAAPALAPFRDGVWREVGAALERAGQESVPSSPDWPLRPGDVLAVLEARRGPAPGAASSVDLEPDPVPAPVLHSDPGAF